MIDPSKRWTHEFAVFSNKYGGDEYALFVPLWLALFVQVLVLFNIVGWGIYGLVELVLKVV